MNLWSKILSLFKRKKPEPTVFKYTPNLPPIESEKERPKSILTARQKAVKRWLNKTYKGKAHKMPLAKFLNPEKYF